MKLPKFLTKEVTDRYAQENFVRLNELIGNLGGLASFSHREFTIIKTGTQTLKHQLGFQPKDLVVTSQIGAGKLTWNYSEFTRETLSVTASNLEKHPLTKQEFTSSSGYYVKPTAENFLYARIRLVAGGGGGSSNGTAGSAGGTTSFGDSFLTCTGGGGGFVTSGAGGAGGTATIAASSVVIPTATGMARSGGSGSGGTYAPGGSAGAGGTGAASPFGGAGGGGHGNGGTLVAGSAAIANTGSGGGGGNINGAGSNAGGGGGAGGYIDVIIEAKDMAETYAYAIGAGGAGGTASASSGAGGNGGSGYLLVEEFYAQSDAEESDISSSSPLVVRLYIGTHQGG